MKASFLQNEICPTQESQFHHNYPIAGHRIMIGPLNRCLLQYLYITFFWLFDWNVLFSLMEQKNSGSVDMNVYAKSLAIIYLIFVFLPKILEKTEFSVTVCLLTPHCLFPHFGSQIREKRRGKGKEGKKIFPGDWPCYDIYKSVLSCGDAVEETDSDGRLNL